ncbi:hypothetical protein [Pleurochrysis sp. endemic virus unk]|nr:hypothetical protein [Pleurochrysis sp. endemic virus 1b]AUL80809.1 hypothetical protein [Pleurochrysis sp. endemic virus unk]
MSRRRAPRPVFDKTQLSSAWENNNLSSLNLRLVQYESLKKSEVKGVTEEQLMELLRPITNMVTGMLKYDYNETLQTIRGDNNEGFDVTALFANNSNLCIGAAISLFYAKRNTLLSHLTAVHATYQIGRGVGELLRRAQLHFLQNTDKFKRAQPKATHPLQFVTLAAKPLPEERDERGKRGAVQFNQTVFRRLGWEERSEEEAEAIIRMLDADYGHLKLGYTLDHVLVQPLLFRAPDNEEGAQSTVQSQGQSTTTEQPATNKRRQVPTVEPTKRSARNARSTEKAREYNYASYVKAQENIINQKLEERAFSIIGTVVIQFDAMDQKPYEAMKKREVGIHVNSKISGKEYMLYESVEIVNFLVDKARVIYTKPQLWRWIGHTKGLDITAVYSFKDVVGASLGLYWPLKNLYFTFVTRVAPQNYQRSGIGKLMRTKQLARLRGRMSELWQNYVQTQTASSSQQVNNDNVDDVEDEPPYFNMPLRVLSLGYNTQGGGSSQGGFNERVMQHLNFDVVKGTDAQTSEGAVLFRQLHEAFPEFKLSDLTDKYGMEPILFKARTLDV